MSVSSIKSARHLVVFAKQPRLGAVKTRLAADIGMAQARRFYQNNTKRLLHRLGGDPRWMCWLAVTPDRAAIPRLWSVPGADGWVCVPQGPGDLGERMGRVAETFAPAPVIIIGTDVPDINKSHITKAFGVIETHQVVFGPATDGGYWLVGFGRRSRRRGVFDNVRWSTKDALADTVANLKGRQSVGYLEQLSDIDDGDDYARWRSRD